MLVVAVQTAETASTRDATEILLKIFDSTYAKANHKQVANKSSQMNSEEITQLISILKDFEYLFGVTLGDWYTYLINLG